MSKMPTSRAQALRLGKPRYFTGRPCKYGHVADRTASSGNCTECFRTVHAECRRDISRRNIHKRIEQRDRVNNETRAKAVNGREEWTTEDMLLVTERDATGRYVFTARELCQMLGRSLRGIERARWRFRERAGGEP